MQFEQDQVENFKLLFEKYKAQIRGAEGCLYLELIQDKHYPTTFFTYSHWEREENLQMYKDSAVFGEVWPKTKAMFSGSPQAWSLDRLHQLP